MAATVSGPERLPTALTTLLGIEHPVVLAPMGSVAGGRLAAVSTAGHSGSSASATPSTPRSGASSTRPATPGWGAGPSPGSSTDGRGCSTPRWSATRPP